MLRAPSIVFLAIVTLLTSCGGGGGDDGPEPIAPDQYSPSELEEDTLFVYWITADRATDDEHLMRYSKATGTIDELAIVDDPMALAQDESHLYWTEVGDLLQADSLDGRILRVSKSGGAVETLVTGIQNPTFLTVDDTSVYWSSVGDILAPDPADYGLWQAPKAGGAPVQLASTTGDAGVAVFGDTLYFTDFIAGTISSLPTAGGSPTLLASGQDGPVRIEADATHVYWSNEGSNDLWRVVISGGTPEPLGATESRTQRFALDETHVYFFSPGGLSRLAKAGGVIEPLTTTTDVGRDIASGAESIYWTSGTFNAVYRLSIPR